MKTATPNTRTKFRFKPWVGENYRRSSLGLRVLIIGESHYWLKGRIPKDLTNFVIQKIRSGSEPVKATLGGVQRIMNAILPESLGERVWDEIAFYNYLQSWIGKNAAHRPNWREFHKEECSQALV